MLARRLQRTQAVDEGSDRDSLVYGTYKPTYELVGILPNSTLTAYNNPSDAELILPEGGGTIQNKIIYGTVRPHPNGGYWVFRNCRLVGAASVANSPTGIVRAYDQRSPSSWTTANWSTAGRLHFIDCEFRPQTPSLYRDGITGFGYTLERCLVTGGVVDCCGSYITTDKGSYVNNRILGCILEKTGYYYTDARNDHNDGTHNDLIQHQGGGNLEVIGNWLNGEGYGYIPGSDEYSDYPWMPDRWACGACVLIQNNTGAPDTTVANCKVRNNWMNGGKFQFVIDANQGVDVSGNKHSSDVARRGANGALGANYNGVHVWIKDATTADVPGLTDTVTSTALDGSGAGQPLDVWAGAAGQGWGANCYVLRTPSWPSGMTDASGTTYA